MATSFEKERAQIAADEEKLAERKRKLEEREREVVVGALERSGLMNLKPDRAKSLCDRIRKLGVDEVERRLALDTVPAS